MKRKAPKVILFALVLSFLLGALTLALSPPPMFAQSPNVYAYLPIVFRSSPAPSSTSTPTQPSPPPPSSADWHQHAADAQRTSYMPQFIPTPW
ncbi:MAG: hypothetical protein N3D16_05555, partial [Anaerolineales bacterium]|nr:hypothetical protein [Anaerolineales bacterium]